MLALSCRPASTPNGFLVHLLYLAGRAASSLTTFAFVALQTKRQAGRLGQASHGRLDLQGLHAWKLPICSDVPAGLNKTFDTASWT